MTGDAESVINGVPRQARRHAEHPVLRVDGLVAQPRHVAPAEFDALPHVLYYGAVSCLESGNRPKRNWSGVRLSDIVAVAQPATGARWIRVSAGPYTVSVAMDDAGSVLLCDRIAGERMGAEQGGPWRLVVPDRLHYTSVKWVDRIEVAADEPDESATRIADARARARERKASSGDSGAGAAD